LKLNRSNHITLSYYFQEIFYIR